MKSMTEVKKGIGRGLAGAALAAALFAVPTHAGVLAGGTVPVINTVRAIGNTSIDLSSDGTDVPIVAFYIDNNTPGAFTLSVTMTNGGFAPPGGVVADGVAFTVVDVVPPATPSGTLGTGATAWADLTQAAPAAAAVTSVYTGTVQTTATVDYQRAITASWTADATLLAGYYGESFTINLSAVF